MSNGAYSNSAHLRPNSDIRSGPHVLVQGLMTMLRKAHRGESIMLKTKVSRFFAVALALLLTGSTALWYGTHSYSYRDPRNTLLLDARQRGGV